MADELARTPDEARVNTELVRRISQGDRAAETELWNRYSRGLLFMLRRWTGDPDAAEDLRQDTFEIAIEKIREGSLNDPAALAGFLRGIARNRVSGKFQKRKRHKTTADSDVIAEVPDLDADPAGEVSREETAALVRELLDELPVPRDREILLRLYVHDADRAEICAELGISSEHFSRVLFRSKGRFRELLLEAERRGRIELVEP